MERNFVKSLLELINDKNYNGRPTAREKIFELVNTNLLNSEVAYALDVLPINGSSQHDVKKYFITHYSNLFTKEDIDHLMKVSDEHIIEGVPEYDLEKIKIIRDIVDAHRVTNSSVNIAEEDIIPNKKNLS